MFRETRFPVLLRYEMSALVIYYRVSPNVAAFSRQFVKRQPIRTEQNKNQS